MGRRKRGVVDDFLKSCKDLWNIAKLPYDVYRLVSGPKKKKRRTTTTKTITTTTYITNPNQVVVKPRKKQTKEEIITEKFARNKTVANPTKQDINRHFAIQRKGPTADKDLLDELANDNVKSTRNITTQSREDDMLETMMLLDMMDEENNKIKKDRLLPGEQNTPMTYDDEDYDWETHCEFCGELLEDCECEHRQLSRQDISQEDDDLELDEMNDVWDESDQMEEDEEFEEDDDDLSFDNFNSFDDDDDF